ncbi:prepilin-type N-terminal cleavage/methylation domain-containing protein [Clostridium algidicarnis]|uniref:prepilin-type N-terminal cleavage/methylation domain-containing protein n=1 Tax=Clostridium algidicarnis TaxID=37659 RepID=UPI00162499A4|nr:prepilin-type N-terminal cleavage/methylation domain-containing protein [Clostridium algidicarnis]MBB6632132.1 prepilin-type N-terminal cleavage/methylation domain-containing protein [Clostridium algidicarnis]
MRELITKERKKKKGFTLIELIIVLAIIAIIAAIAIPNFTKVRADSKVKADTQSAETIRRITLTLLADDELKPGDSILLTLGDDKKMTATKTAATSSGTATDADLKEYFKEVKAPQQDLADEKKNYVVTVDKAGNVKVVVGKVTVPEIKK